jgi:polar amino acid transport system substrate-binding protein
MRRQPLTTLTVVAAVASGLVLAGCATASTPSAASNATGSCSKSSLRLLTPGALTVGTDTPAYPPYYEQNDPSNGKGFESEVAYAVAKSLGFASNEVKWAVVPFDSSYKPGSKSFDFDINQISITDARKQVVDFSSPYFTVPQAVVALKGSKFADATSIAALKGARLGAQVGTTSLTFIQKSIAPGPGPQVFNDTNGAKHALSNGTLDAIVVDLPTAFYITAAEITNGKVVGQFAPDSSADRWGMLFQKGNPLVGCVNEALAKLTQSGELQQITNRVLSTEAQAPLLK